MRIALLSDIHANTEALTACLRHADERGAQRFAFLGDFVGYGADPGGVVDIVIRYAAQGAVALKGNHDQAEGNHAAVGQAHHEVVRGNHGLGAVLKLWEQLLHLDPRLSTKKSFIPVNPGQVQRKFVLSFHRAKSAYCCGSSE